MTGALLERVRANSLTLGDQPALMAGADVIRWRELWPIAQSLAARLRQAGEGPVALSGSPDQVWRPAAFLACLIAGRPYLPLDPGLPLRRQRELAAGLGAQWLEEGEALAGFAAGRSCPPAEDGERLAYLLFTSGTTGAPKPVGISLRNLESFLHWAVTLPGLADSAGETAVGQAAWSFDLSVADLYLALVQGGTHVALTEEEKGDYPALLRRLEACHAALLVTTPTFLRLCLAEPGFSPARLPGLRTVFSCGEALPPAAARRLLDRFPGCTLLNAYGPTEAACAVTAVPITRDMCAGPLPIGRWGEGAVSVTLEEGELILTGESVAPAFGGRYATGDLGYVKEGLLYWAGRKDHQLKYKGYRIEPAEIEGALESLPGVERAAVLPRRGPGGEVRGLTAVVEGSAPVEELRTGLARLLPPCKCPGRWVTMDRIPLTPNGKCDRKRLEEMIQ